MNAAVGGTFTPVLGFGGATTGIAYSTQTGSYTRIGSLVYYYINIVLTSKGSATGQATITGLPFTASGDGFGSFTSVGNVASWVSGSIQIVSGSSTVTPFLQTSTGQSGYTDTNFTNTTILHIAGIYNVGSL
jgi:hypothetical protein